MKLNRVGLIGRFKPLHNGAILMLEAAFENANEVVIGIGSSNKYNLRNPFTAKETKEMLSVYLTKRYNNYKIIEIPDFAHIPEYKDGQKWCSYIKENFGELDAFITGNDYVAKLLKNYYKIIEPWHLIPKEKWIPLRATGVRIEIARYGPWKSLVPAEVAEYLEKNNLVKRFRQEFGLECLAKLIETNYTNHENAEEEMLHTTEV